MCAQAGNAWSAARCPHSSQRGEHLAGQVGGLPKSYVGHGQGLPGTATRSTESNLERGATQWPSKPVQAQLRNG